MTNAKTMKYRTRATELNIADYLAKHAGNFIPHGREFDVVANNVFVKEDQVYRFGEGQRTIKALIMYSRTPKDYMNSVAFKIGAPNYGINDGETTLELLVDSGPGFLRFYRTYTLREKFTPIQK